MAELDAARTRQESESEMGDLLFAVANWARHLGVEPELALRQASQRFATRFRAMEDLARRRGIELRELDIDGMEALWQEVKA
jgi:uncharacterized protein YabN with tetrapyrrole methylase and pyrophosphatase domain